MSTSDQEKQRDSMKLRDMIRQFEAKHGASTALATIGLSAVKMVRDHNMSEVNMDLGVGGGTMNVSAFGGDGSEGAKGQKVDSMEEASETLSDRTLH